MVKEDNMYFAEINIQQAIMQCTTAEELYLVCSRITETLERYEALKVKELEENAED